MDNIETTKTKKKMSILDIVEVTGVFLILALIIVLDVTKRELLLFGYLFEKYFLTCVFYLTADISLFSGIKAKKINKKQKIAFIVGCVMTVVIIVLGLPLWYGNIKDTVDTERLTLSDGNEVLLRERVHPFSDGTDYTYMDVYRIDGIIAKNLGKIDETYFSNKCLLQDKYTYEYDETSKMLTIICEYGTYGENSAARLTEEYDTGFWEVEFTLE